MAQAKKQLEINDFSGGFNTEQNPLRADPSTTIEEQNMILASDGSRARRYGLSVDESAVTSHFAPTGASQGTPFDVSVINAFDLTSADDETNKYTFLTRNRTDTLDLPTLVGFQQEGSSFNNPVTLSYPSSQDFSGIAYNFPYVSVANTLLFPRGSGVQPLAYNGSAAILDASGSATITFRDLWGVDDGLAVTDRPLSSALTANHAYNLYNQGWTAEAIIKFNTEVGFIPSNADTYYYGLIPDVATTQEVYDPEILKTSPFPNGAPKGRHYLSAEAPGSSRRSTTIQAFFDLLNTAFTLTLSTVDINIVSPASNSWWNVNSIASFLGRAFYTGNLYQKGTGYFPGNTSGDKVPQLSNFLFFSRTVDTTEPFGFPEENSFSDKSPYVCASVIDPTAENFTPSATDGGFILVSEAERLLGCFSLRDSLLIVATNGVWELRAQDGFTPSTFILSKIAAISVDSVNPIISANNFLTVPAREGLFLFYYDGESRRTVARNISDAKIRSYYNSKRKWLFAGAYNEAASEMRWLLHTPVEDQTGTTNVTVEQEELVYDMRLESFQINVFPSCTVDVVGSSKRFRSKPVYGKLGNFGTITPTNTGHYITNYLQVPDEYSIGAQTTAIDEKRNRVSLRYVVIEPLSYNIGIASPTKGVYADFGTDVTAFMVTNPMTLGDTIHPKNFQKVWTHFHRTEDGFEDDGSGDWIPTNPSGCLMSGRFDFSDSANSGKWTEPKQVYRLERDYLPEDINDTFDYGQYLITTKSDVPGQGLSLSLKFESEAGKDMQIVGWGTLVKVNEGY